MYVDTCIDTNTHILMYMYTYTCTLLYIYFYTDMYIWTTTYIYIYTNITCIHDILDRHIQHKITMNSGLEEIREPCVYASGVWVQCAASPGSVAMEAPGSHGTAFLEGKP